MKKRDLVVISADIERVVPREKIHKPSRDIREVSTIMMKGEDTRINLRCIG